MSSHLLGKTSSALARAPVDVMLAGAAPAKMRAYSDDEFQAGAGIGELSWL
jgi:hypothetical protein